MTSDQLVKLGFKNDEYTLRNGLTIMVDDLLNNKFCLCTGLDEFFELDIYTIYDLEQFIKIMGG